MDLAVRFVSTADFPSFLISQTARSLSLSGLRCSFLDYWSRDLRRRRRREGCRIGLRAAWRLSGRSRCRLRKRTCQRGQLKVERVREGAQHEGNLEGNWRRTSEIKSSGSGCRPCVSSLRESLLMAIDTILHHMMVSLVFSHDCRPGAT